MSCDITRRPGLVLAVRAAATTCTQHTDSWSGPQDGLRPSIDGIFSLRSELIPQTRLNITEIAMPAAGPAVAAAPAAAEAPAEEKPKEKTIFTVKLEKIDAAQKAKVIREVKAMMPNMNLVEVSLRGLLARMAWLLLLRRRRVAALPEGICHGGAERGLGDAGGHCGGAPARKGPAVGTGISGRGGKVDLMGFTLARVTGS